MSLLKSYIAPPGTGPVNLGYTLPSLLDEVCDRHPQEQALHHWVQGRWQSLSHQAFRLMSEELALGFLTLHLHRGDRVSLFMASDINFCIADMAGLMAGLVDVPIDLHLNSAAIQYILQHTESPVLITSNLDLLQQLAPLLPSLPRLRTVVLAEVPLDWEQHLPELPAALEVKTLEGLREAGRAQWSEQRQQQLRRAIAPNDLATIVYTASPVGQPRGVMLSHASLSGDILAALGALPGLEVGQSEVVLSFLPLTHIFARAFLYGHLYYGHQIYFTSPARVTKHLREVQPTIFITVPRLLEKVYEKLVETGNQLPGWQRLVFRWGLGLAQRYRLGQHPRGFYGWQLKLADRWVFSQWRSPFGERMKVLISGGAALRAELATVFSAAGVPLLQGYGLTESGGVLTYNRGVWNRAGTVGVPIAGVEVAIAADGEILAKTPYAMQGYYRDPEATRHAIDLAGWLHTGDLGRFTEEGFLQITGHKKDLFKLSTGKYVAPHPIEQQLKLSPFVKQAVVVGAQQKFTTLLIFPDLEYLCPRAEGMCAAFSLENLLRHPKITALYQALVDEINPHLPHWSTIKRFRLLHLILTVEDATERPSLSLSRDAIHQLFASEIDAMYVEGESAPQEAGRTAIAHPDSAATRDPPIVTRRFLRPLTALPRFVHTRFLQPLSLRIVPSRAKESSDHA